MANSSRMQRVSDEIQKTLVNVLRKKIRDPRLTWVSITSVEVSKDLSSARVFYTSLSDQATPDDINKAFIKSLGFFKTCLAKEMALRITPSLKFIHDTSSEYGNKMDALIQKARTQDEDFIKPSDNNENTSSDDSPKDKRERLR